MSHATMCGNVYDDERHSCFVPWCSCSCHLNPDPADGSQERQT